MSLVVGGTNIGTGVLPANVASGSNLNDLSDLAKTDNYGIRGNGTTWVLETMAAFHTSMVGGSSFGIETLSGNKQSAVSGTWYGMGTAAGHGAWVVVLSSNVRDAGGCYIVSGNPVGRQVAAVTSDSCGVQWSGTDLQAQQSSGHTTDLYWQVNKLAAVA